MAALLDGIRVLDLTVFQQGPYASTMLADLGADVIKIEGPDTPDPGRGFDLPGGGSDFHSYFQTLNRGKRAISIDLKTEGGRKVLHTLVESADVFVSNVRYKALQRLCADYETLSVINPGPSTLTQVVMAQKGRMRTWARWTCLGWRAAV